MDSEMKVLMDNKTSVCRNTENKGSLIIRNIDVESFSYVDVAHKQQLHPFLLWLDYLQKYSHEFICAV